MRISLPNQITLGRLVLAATFFVVLGQFEARHLDEQRWLLLVAFWIFLISALADVLDGHLARTMNQETTFGRVVDPVVDKVLVCGAFVYLCSAHFFDGTRQISGVQPWMLIVILVREMLVSAIRAHRESEGHAFGAAWSGKLKMFLQCTAVCVVLGTHGWQLTSLAPLRDICVWAAVVVTAISALAYVGRARSFLLEGGALAPGPRP